MANIFDYLSWRGDISLKEDSFNDVDNLVLSWLAYISLEGVMPCGICNEPITIKEAIDKFFELYDLEEKLKAASMTKTSALLFYNMADCPRFYNMRIVNYVNHISEELQKQFSAMTIEVDEDTLYVAFRGTDDTIVGWREDFNMSFLQSVPAQIEAAKYLQQSVGTRKEKLIIGGHSKGGNLAVYSAIHATDEVKQRILQVYNNDGPGFLTATLQSQEYQEMLPKIKTIVPESSVVGMLFGHEEEYEIVRSSQKGIMQHDAGTWEVNRNKLVYLDSVSNASKFFDKSFKTWVANQNDEQRKMFVDGLFSLLEASGAKTTGELYALGFKNISSAAKKLNSMEPELKQNLLLITKSLFDIIGNNMKLSIRKEAAKSVRRNEDLI